MTLKILVPIDFSERSEHALEMTASLFRDAGAQFVLLNVVPLPIDVSGIGLAAPDAEEVLALERDLQHVAAHHAVRATVKVSILEDPGVSILRVASEQRCDLIALGTRGRGGVERALFGSVADHVMRHAQCPVLMIRHSARMTT